MKYGINSEFWREKRVFVTGHTGFKGAWLCTALLEAGARVTGYALAPESNSLFEAAGVARLMDSREGDVRDAGPLSAAVREARPEILIHMAAQPLVIDGYERPAYTYETNVMGTVNVLEAARGAGCVRSLLNVTTDKVYLNEEEPGRGYAEGDRLDGFDPYSNSKSCSELVTATYARCFLSGAGCAVSCARSGNVIGSGDWAQNRIVPDCVRAALAGEAIGIRNPSSTRPYQHVLEPVSAYLEIAAAQLEDPSLAGAYNVGPCEGSCVTTGELAGLFCDAWGEGASWHAIGTRGPHEANFLALDASKVEGALGWKPRWDVREAVRQTVRGYRDLSRGGDALASVRAIMSDYFGSQRA